MVLEELIHLPFHRGPLSLPDAQNPGLVFTDENISEIPTGTGGILAPETVSKNIIENVGNYGEVFASNIGESTPIGLARGLNAQYTEGGLIYAPPFR